jgi:outer membrane protein insertion porin family
VRFRLRQALRAGVVVVSSAALIAVLALLFVHTPPGRSAARAAVERWASHATGGTVRLGGLDVALWRGVASAVAVRLDLPDATVEVARATVAWSPGSGAHLLVLRPSIVVRTRRGEDAPEPPARGLAAQPWRVLERLRAAQVVDGRLEVRDETDKPWMLLRRFDLEMAGATRALTLRVAGAALGWPGAGLRVDPAGAEARLAVRAGTLVIERARITAPHASLDLDGSLERIEPVGAGGSARALLDGTFVRAIVPESRVMGAVEARAVVRVAGGAVTGTVEAGSRALTVAEVGPWDVSGRGRLDGARLHLDAFGAAGFGGRIEAAGALALAPTARTELRLQARGVDPRALARALAGVDLPVSSRASAALLWTAQGWDVPTSRGDGRVTLARGEGPGIPAAGEAVVRLRGRDVAIDAAHVESRGARGSASLRFASEGTLGGVWSVEMPLPAVARLLADLGTSVRPPAIEGTVIVRGRLSGSAADPRAAATLHGEGIAAAGAPVGVEGELRYGKGALSLAPLVVRSGAGAATLTGTVPLAGGGEWDVGGAIEALDLAPLHKALGLPGESAATGAVRLTGRRDVPAARLSLQATVRLPRTTEPAADEVRMVLEAGSLGRRVGLERLDADVAGGRISVRGSYDAESAAIQAAVKVRDVAWERLPLVPPAARRLTGTLAGEAALSGTAAAPAGTLRLALGNAALDGAAIPPLSLDARADGRELRVEAAAERVFLQGRAPLRGDWPLQVEVDAARLPLQALAEAWPPAREARATLAATGTLTLMVPLRDPSRIACSTSSLAASGRWRQVEWTVAPLAVRGDHDAIVVERLDIAVGRGSVAVRGRWPLRAAGGVELKVEADLDLADLDRERAGRRALAGKAGLRLAVAGTLDAPDLAGTLRLTGVRGDVEGALLEDLELEARFVDRGLQVDRLSAELLGGQVTARGRLPIVAAAPGPAARFTFEARDLDLARLASRERGESGPDAPALLVAAEGELEAASPSLAALAGRGRLTRLELRVPEDGVALAAPAGFTLAARRFRLEGVRLTGPLGELEAGVEADLAGSSPRATASVAGELDLRALGAFVPDTSLAGRARVDARLTRADGAWRVDGVARVDHGRLSLDALSFAVSEVAGELRFAGDRIEVEAEGASGDGRLQAKGNLRLGAALLGPVDVTLEAQRMPIQYPPGYRGRASGSLRLGGEPGHYRLAGALTMTQGYYTAEVDARSQSLDRLDWQLAALDGGSLGERIALDVAVRLGEPLRVRNSTLHLDLEGGIVISGTVVQPTASGAVTLREGGEITLGHARVRVQAGRVELGGYPAGTPEVDFEGVTRVSGVALQVDARGPIDDLQLTLSSERSDLSQTDLVTLLLTGRTAAAAASQGGVVVAEQLAVALGGVLQKGVGDSLLIDVSPDRSLLTDDTDPTQRFNVGTRITQNVTVVYSAALDGTEKRWILEFNPGGGRFRLRAISEEDNSLSLEGSDRFAFDLWSRGRRRTGPPRETDRLTDVRFEGELPIAAQTLRGAVKLRTGRRYSALQREQAADHVRERLVRAGYRSASVEALTQPAPGGVLLVLRVVAGPQVPITWGGDDPGGGVREAAEKAWPASGVPELAAAQVARTALVRLQSAGYYTARVTSQTRAEGGRVHVRIEVARGVPGKGVDVEFEGNHVLDDAALAAGLPKPGSREFFEGLDARSARIANHVRLAYAGVGYVRARVGTPRTAFDAARGRLRVTIPVRERGPSVVEAVELPAEAARASGLALRLAPGHPFDLAAYVADRDALSAWYLANGWVEAQVRGVLQARGPRVSVRYVAEAGPRPRVAEIRVDEPGRTRDSLIRRSLSVREGDFIRPADLAETRERLSEIGVFRSVDVRAEPAGDDPTRRDVVVGLLGKPDVQVEYGLRYTTAGEGGGAGASPSSPTEARLQLAGAIEFSNPFGYGVKTRAYGFGTTDRQTWGVTFDAATLAGRRLRTQLFVFDDHDQDVEVSGVASHIKGLTAQQTRVLLRDRRSRRWHDRLRLQWGYTFKDIEYVESAANDLLTQGDRGFASLALVGDERDSLTDPSRGVFWTASTEMTRTWLGSDVDYVRLYGQLFTYVPLGRLVWAQGFRLGTVPGDDPLLLLENRFRAGGPTTVRGYEQSALGPQTAEGDSLGGQAVAVFNQELRFPIVGRLKGGLFWDAGNVWLTAGEFDLGDLRHSVGAGLRYVFPFGPVRVEYAWIVGRRSGEPAGRFVFGLGHAF